MTIKREQYYLDNLKNEYNIQKTAGGTFGYKHTPETREKMRKRKQIIKGEALPHVKVDLRNMGNNKTTSHSTQVDAATFLGLKPKALAKRKATAANLGIPLLVKAKAGGIKGNWFHLTFPYKN